MKILVACEESQAVTKEMRKKGHEAYSCDIQECSGGHPEWHIQGDAIALLERGWDMLIAFPPCTYLSNAGIRWFNEERYGEKARQRKRDREEALQFFLAFMNAPIPKVCVENPVGYPNSQYRKPDQIIHPWYFGDDAKKRTCFWLKGLEPLVYDLSDKEEPKPIAYFKTGKKKGQPIHWSQYMHFSEDRGKIRSKTFPSVAKAMAEQWG